MFFTGFLIGAAQLAASGFGMSQVMKVLQG
jgi:hypothetical protein